jgi:hypothetical protein
MGKLALSLARHVFTGTTSGNQRKKEPGVFAKTLNVLLYFEMNFLNF